VKKGGDASGEKRMEHPPAIIAIDLAVIVAGNVDVGLALFVWSIEGAGRNARRRAALSSSAKEPIIAMPHFTSRILP
jgi:hypothetical protein